MLYAHSMMRSVSTLESVILQSVARSHPNARNTTLPIPSTQRQLQYSEVVTQQRHIPAHQRARTNNTCKCIQRQTCKVDFFPVPRDGTKLYPRSLRDSDAHVLFDLCWLQSVLIMSTLYHKKQCETFGGQANDPYKRPGGPRNDGYIEVENEITGRQEEWSSKHKRQSEKAIPVSKESNVSERGVVLEYR
ncbi:hypothetical protein BDW69DRAFT_138401 [Aspergillus filifer]